MTIWENIQRFAKQYSRNITVSGTTWQYFRLGAGTPVLWLTGGLRRAAAGASFLEKLAERHLVIATDHPPVRSITEFNTAFDAILKAEGVESCFLVGQSYGGMLAQAYLAHNPQQVERLILSSSGPADFGKAWLPVESACIALARLLPEQTLKNMLAGGLLKLVNVPEDLQAEWSEAMHHILQDELTRADVVSHFAVAADLIKRGSVRTGAFANWTGRIVVLRARNDPTQSEKDLPRYARLFGRPVDVIEMGNMGHAGVLSNPDDFIQLFEQAFD